MEGVHVKSEDTIKVVDEMVRYSNWACTTRARKGAYIKQVFFPITIRTENIYVNRIGHSEASRARRTIWVRLDNMKSQQKCLSVSRIKYQLRRVPHKEMPTVVKLKSGQYVIWDGNHRATAHMMRGRVRIKCKELRKAA